MNTPNPLSPLSPLSQATKGRSNVRIAVISIVALHAVFFTGLLMQGCGKKDNETQRAENAYFGADATTSTNTFGSSGLPELGNNPYADTSTSNVVAGPDPLASWSSVPATTGTLSGAASAWPPGLNGGYTAPLPGSYVQEMVPSLAPADSLAEYEIKKSDTLAKVAAAHGVSLDSLMAANPGVDTRKLQIKQKIRLPAAKAAPSGAGPLAGSATNAPGETIYQVKAGDTLYKIARDHGVTVADLRRANKLRTDRITVKQTLKIPASARTAPAGGTPPTGFSPSSFNPGPDSAVGLGHLIASNFPTDR
ncbi:MAG: LysM peptidoglycan-binding domain-containing protein [Limisphaerales bacterium]